MTNLAKVKYKYVFAITYTICIVLFTAYILLDTYVLRKKGMEVDVHDYVSDEIKESGVTELEDNSYKDDNISIEIFEIRRYNTTIHVANIKINDIKYLKTALAEDKFGKNILEKVSSMAERKKAIFAINGDYYGWKNAGYVLRNGTLYRDTKQKDIYKEDLIIYSDGTIEIINENDSDIDSILDDDPWQILAFGPAAVKDGVVFKYNDNYDEIYKIKNPRTAIGFIDDLNYVVLVADGRYPNEDGVTLEELGNIFLEYGANNAYNLDGGGSSVMWFDGKVINKPVNGKGIIERSVSDIVYIGY